MLALAGLNPRQIYFTGRNAQAGEEVIDEAKQVVPGCKVTFIQCDLSSSRHTIRRTLLERFRSDRLDIFIANAGIMAAPPSLTEDGFEVQFGTNHIGHAVMLKLLRPLLHRTSEMPGADVRILMLSSFGHTTHPSGGIEFENLKVPDAGSGWLRYGQSKLANILTAKAMAKREPKITSVSIHPGVVRTGLINGTDSSPLAIFFRMTRWMPFYKTPEQGAQNTLWAATAPKDQLRDGGYYEPVGKFEQAKKTTGGMDPICNDTALADRLWDWTENELKDVEPL